jgi:pyruvate ferredoxin oxidoreductase delta subunit
MIEEHKIAYEGNRGVPVIREMGNAIEVHTGLWRTERPHVDFDRCIKCKLCYLYCPVTAYKWSRIGPICNYHFCKGCGICAQECPVKAIEMVKEERC